MRKKLGLFWFAVLLGAALIFSGCEGETKTETNTVFVSYEEVAESPEELQDFLETYSRVAYAGTSFDAGKYGGSVTVPAGKTLGLFGTIAAGTLVVEGTVNVEINSILSDVTANSVITTGAGGFIVVGKGGTFKTDRAVASLPVGLSVTGGVLEYDATAAAAGNIADGGSITALLGKVSSGVLKIGSTSIGPVAITAVATALSENKKLAVTTSEHAGTAGTPLPLIIPVGLILTTPGLTSVTDVTVQGGGSLIFSGAPGSLSLAVGSAFTLNEGGAFEADVGSKGLVLDSNGSISITGSWVGGSSPAVITGAAAGGTVSGKLDSVKVKANSKINIGTFSALSLEENAGIDITGGTIAMVGTASTHGATIYFGENTGILFSGETGAEPFAAGTIANVGSTGIVYGTAAAGGSLVSITSTSGGSIAAGTTSGYKALDLYHQTEVK